DQFWPILTDMSMYSLRVAESGMREPHWHPVTAEMGYVHYGDAHPAALAGSLAEHHTPHAVTSPGSSPSPSAGRYPHRSCPPV
ncbi:cupin domain-containing protein, partial [Mycobacterium sp. ITM-2017-0098]